MKKTKIILAIVATVIVAFASNAQPIRVIEDRETPVVEPLKLDGPRVGFGYAMMADNSNIKRIYGDEDLNVDPFVSLFGWQFEWRYFTTNDGSQGLIEFIPMIGGLDQSMLLPMANILIGYRSPQGFEFGAGPSVSLVGTGLVVAIGKNFRSEHVNFPVNLSFHKGKDSMRLGLTFGFNKRSKQQGELYMR